MKYLSMLLIVLVTLFSCGKEQPTDPAIKDARVIENVFGSESNVLTDQQGYEVYNDIQAMLVDTNYQHGCGLTLDGLPPDTDINMTWDDSDNTVCYDIPVDCQACPTVTNFLERVFQDPTLEPILEGYQCDCEYECRVGYKCCVGSTSPFTRTCLENTAFDPYTGSCENQLAACNAGCDETNPILSFQRLDWKGEDEVSYYYSRWITWLAFADCTSGTLIEQLDQSDWIYYTAVDGIPGSGFPNDVFPASGNFCFTVPQSIIDKLNAGTVVPFVWSSFAYNSLAGELDGQSEELGLDFCCQAGGFIDIGCGIHRLSN